MRRLMLLVGTSFFMASVLSGAAASSGSGQARWVIRDLGTLGGKESAASGIDDRGQIVGVSGT